MKKLMILVLGALLILPLVNSLGAEEVIGDIRPNILRPGRMDVVDVHGNVHYYLERDVINQSRWIIYHSDSGHKAGVIERNPLKMYDYDIKVKRPTGIRMYDKGVKTRFRRFTR